MSITPHALSIDAATVSGWALCDLTNRNIVDSGVWKMHINRKKGESDGDRLLKLWSNLRGIDEKDNVHWFIANTETAFTFDVIMLDLNEKPYDIHNLDIFEKQDLSDGNMQVPILDVETALKKYGKQHH